MAECWPGPVVSCLAKLPRDTSKWTSSDCPDDTVIGVEFEITQVCVSADTYGAAWYTSPGCSANVAAKKALSASLVESSSMGDGTPRVTRASSRPRSSIRHASPMAPG